MLDGLRVVCIVAVAENGVIGAAGGLPWRLSSDLKHFRQLTMGKPMIMGRKTYQSIARVLDGRDTIVVTRASDFSAEGVLVAGTIEAALEQARVCAERRGTDEITVIGGADVYQAVLPYTDCIHLTRVHAAPEGDTYFPELDPGEWRVAASERHAAGPRDDYDTTQILLERMT